MYYYFYLNLAGFSFSLIFDFYNGIFECNNEKITKYNFNKVKLGNAKQRHKT